VTPPAPPREGHRLRELIGTLVGLAVLLVAGLGILWATKGQLDDGASRRNTVVHGSLPSQRSENQRPLGVPANAQALTVQSARDGTTFTARPAVAGSPISTTASVLVRLIGVAAPAMPTIGRPMQCFAEDAYHALQRLAPVGSRVWVIADAQLRDPDGSYLLYIWNSAGTFVNLALADGGYVRADVMKPNTARQGAIQEAIDAAMKARRGLWGRCGSK
jgi:endonuclease YncB( thermonuclease family)